MINKFNHVIQSWLAFELWTCSFLIDIVYFLWTNCASFDGTSRRETLRAIQEVMVYLRKYWFLKPSCGAPFVSSFDNRLNEVSSKGDKRVWSIFTAYSLTYNNTPFIPGPAIATINYHRYSNKQFSYTNMHSKHQWQNSCSAHKL